MKKYFFISNRQSGKTHLAIYEFMKDPDNSLLIVYDNKQIKNILDKKVIPDKFLDRIFHYENFSSKIMGRSFKIVIFDDYLLTNTEFRSEIDINIHAANVEKIYCFSTPSKLYDKNVLDFVTQVKKDKRILIVEEYMSKNQLLIEINDLKIKTSAQLHNEIWDLYYNYLTDPETKIIHDKFFYNERIFNLENVSYFPDIERELTELKGEFIKN
jgi:hypothetical protein